MPKSNFLPHKVYIKLYVLGSAMVDWIGAHVAGRDVVTKDDGRMIWCIVELTKKLSQTCAFSYSISDTSIFSFSA